MFQEGNIPREGTGGRGAMFGTEVLPLLLFPKPFELFSFLSSMPDQAFIYDAELEGIRLYAIHLKGHDRTIKMYVHSLDSSDIDFSFKLGTFINWLQVKKNLKLYLLLCGSCGGSAIKKVAIGSTYRVTKAIKFDRGVITENDGELILTIEEKGNHLYSSSTNISWGESVLCSNHVMCMDPVTLSERLNLKDPCILCDMETYEFFSTCQLMEVSKYDCIRVVSDVFQAGSSRMKEKLIRKHVSMAKVWDDVIEIQFEEAMQRRYVPYQEPTEVIKINSTYLKKRMQEKIDRIRHVLKEEFRRKGELVTPDIEAFFRVTPVPGASLPGASLPGAPLPGAPLPGGPLPGAPLPGGPLPGAPLPGASVPGASLPGASVPGASLPGASLPGASLPGAPLPGAPLPEASVPEASLPGASLPGAPVPGAPVPGAPVPGAPVPGDSVTSETPSLQPTTSDEDI